MNLKYERYIHRIASVVGGYAAIYAVMVRTTLGSSQTLNLIELLRNILGKNYVEALLHLGGAFLYGGAIFLTTVLSKKGRVNMFIYSMAVNIAGFILLGFLPEDLNTCLGLYPTFVMMSIQWVVFGNLGGYSSSPIFSTNNLRQMSAALAEYVCDHDKKHLDKAKFFGGTLIFFHLGAACGYFASLKFSVKASFLGVIPCMFLIGLVLAPMVVKSKKAVAVQHA